MTPSVALWSGVAVLLCCWAVGAYNRLMRLRAQAYSAFAAVDVELGRQIELVQQGLPQATQPAPLEGTTTASIWAPLQAAAAQLAASLASARAKPLDPERIAALGTARDALATAWDRAQRDEAHDLAGPRMPETLVSARAQLALQAHAATVQFNQAVVRYNEAIAQFPALLLAWLFGFRPARALPAAVIPSQV